MYCNIIKRHFNDYSYVPVSWSGDTLPVCPHCGQSPYEKSFSEFHTEQEDTQ